MLFEGNWQLPLAKVFDTLAALPEVIEINVKTMNTTYPGYVEQFPDSFDFSRHKLKKLNLYGRKHTNKEQLFRVLSQFPELRELDLTTLPDVALKSLEVLGTPILIQEVCLLYLKTILR